MIIYFDLNDITQRLKDNDYESSANFAGPQLRIASTIVKTLTIYES
jgi:hypothetical protein